MKNHKNNSITYRFLCKMGMMYSEEEYGQVSLWTVMCKIFAIYRKALFQSMMDWAIFAPIAARKVRPFLLRRMGAKVGKGVFIGDHVVFDLNHSDMITLDDYAHITGVCRLLCHQRDLKNYRKGDNAALCGYIYAPIHVGKGVMVGMTTFITPGVTIGDGAIIGGGSVVTKDNPAWTIASGRPAKVYKEVKNREITQSVRGGVILSPRMCTFHDLDVELKKVA